jgi:hypothetical protein
MRAVGKLKFSDAQQKQLAELLVVPEQIAQLERVLPLCRAMRSNAPPMDDVRNELLRIEKALRKAATELSRFAKASSSVPALQEAFTRVQCEFFEMPDHGEVIEKARLALASPLTAISRAQRELPTEQRRPSAPWWPIARIHDALVLGWGRAKYPVRHGQVTTVCATAPIPPFPHIPSTGPKNKFRLIVGICYDLMDDTHDSDPERPIKAFCQWYKKDRARLGIHGDAGTSNAP